MPSTTLEPSSCRLLLPGQKAQVGIDAQTPQSRATLRRWCSCVQMFGLSEGGQVGHVEHGDDGQGFGAEHGSLQGSGGVWRQWNWGGWQGSDGQVGLLQGLYGRCRCWYFSFLICTGINILFWWKRVPLDETRRGKLFLWVHAECFSSKMHIIGLKDYPTLIVLLTRKYIRKGFLCFERFFFVPCLRTFCSPQEDDFSQRSVFEMNVLLNKFKI